MKDLVQSALKGDNLSIARLISRVEREEKGSLDAMRSVHKKVRGVPVIGVTGVGGSGKSTLIASLAKEFRKYGKKVGIIAIDPTSPFSGGALLGDRVRMGDVMTDSGVFIRSMGTRGAFGGLASAVYDVTWILDACGFDAVIVETVGVGQDEIDVVKIAETTLVVLVPGLGDSIQMIKAGIMEIGDVLVVNKADMPGVDQTVGELEAMLDLGGRGVERKIPVLRTVAKKGEGVAALYGELQAHREFLEKKVGRDNLRRRRYEGALLEIVKGRVMRTVLEEFGAKGRAQPLVDKIFNSEIDPHTAADELLK
jgi:LAO/AO transport system kinase